MSYHQFYLVARGTRDMAMTIELIRLNLTSEEILARLATTYLEERRNVEFIAIVIFLPA